MTTNKNIKARVRARMERTRESYSTARAHVLKGSAPTAERRPIPLPSDKRRLPTRSHGCAYGDYPWDHWLVRAKAAGVPDDLAQLGRSLMREADQHGWCRELWERCGWNAESAEGMVRFALETPDVADEQWSRLMETDGCIVESNDDFRTLSDAEFDEEYTRFALAFDRYFSADRVAPEEEDPFVQIPGAPEGMRAPRSQVEKMTTKLKGIRDASGKLAFVEANELTNEELDIVHEGIERGWSERRIEAALAFGSDDDGSSPAVKGDS